MSEDYYPGDDLPPFDHEPEDWPPVALEDMTPKPTGHPADELGRHMITGDRFILDAPSTTPAVWGRGAHVLWAEGEALTIVGPPGVGKTTLSGQLLRARLGIDTGDVLGLPVAPTSSRVLYLAMDRPRQIARALARLFTPEDRATLQERLVVWQGPPLADVAKHPATLLALAEEADADTVVVDSLKDAAVGLTEDEVGAGYNRARQMCLRAGVEVLELHHMVKRGQGGNRPNTLADVYGSTWITAGAGSVVLLWGSAGDPVVDLTHLKQPAAEVGPHKVIHDHEAGTSALWGATDVVALAAAPGGVSARQAATVLYSAEKPTEAQVEKARRQLEREVRAGRLAVLSEADPTTRAPKVYGHPTDPTKDPTDHPTGHVSDTHPTDPTGTPRLDLNMQVNNPTDNPTDPTGGAPHEHTPPFKGGVWGACSAKGCTEDAREGKSMCALHLTHQPQRTT